MVNAIKDSAGVLPKFFSELQFPSVSHENFAKNMHKVDWFAAAQLPVMLFSSLAWNIVYLMWQFVSSLANSVAILICYVYLNNHRRHSLIIVQSYIALFKTFSEFIGAVACVCHGLLELNFPHTALGITTILIGVCLRALFLYQETKPQDDDPLLRMASYSLSALYLLAILLCSLAFHQIIVEVGVLPCASRIVTCVIPLVALTDSLSGEGGQVGARFSYVAEAVVVLVLWWFCGHVSLKYFVVVPTVMGLVFSFIQYLIREVQKVASKETEVDLYAK